MPMDVNDMIQGVKEFIRAPFLPQHRPCRCHLMGQDPFNPCGTGSRGRQFHRLLLAGLREILGFREMLPLVQLRKENQLGGQGLGQGCCPGQAPSALQVDFGVGCARTLLMGKVLTHPTPDSEIPVPVGTAKPRLSPSLEHMEAVLPQGTC